jgi:hypothetical protein
MERDFEEFLKRIAGIFAERNRIYAGEEEALANFNRNAKLAEIFKLGRFIDKPYGTSIKFVVEKVDRMINEIHHYLDGKPVSSHFEDHIEDAMVYLFITREALKEVGVI